MTIICAVRTNGETWLGSDTGLVVGNKVFPSAPKWVMNGQWALGISGAMRTQTLVEEKYQEVLAGSPLQIGVNIRKLLLDDGFEPARDKDGKGYPHFGQSCVLVNREAFYDLDGTWNPALILEEFIADGSGWEYATGAYYAAKKAGINRPDRLVSIAIEAAIEHDRDCGGTAWLHRFGDPHGA